MATIRRTGVARGAPSKSGATLSASADTQAGRRKLALFLMVLSMVNAEA